MKHIHTYEEFLNESHLWNPSMKKPIFGSGGNGTSQEYLEGLWKNRNFDIPSSFFEDADKETNKSKQEELIKILGLICDAHNTEKEALRIGEYFLEMWRKKNNLEYDKKAVFESFLNEGTDIKKGDTVEKKFASDEKDYTRKFKVLSIDNSGKAELEEIGNKKTTKMYLSDLSKLNEATEQDYIVTYYTIKNDNDIDWDLEVKAKSPEDAIAKAKSSNDLPRNARAFSAQLKKK